MKRHVNTKVFRIHSLGTKFKLTRLKIWLLLLIHCWCPNNYNITVVCLKVHLFRTLQKVPAVFQLWVTHLHSYETFRPPLCFTQMLTGSVIPACVPPPFFPGALDLYLSMPHPLAAPTPPNLSLQSPASLSLTCTGCCLCLPYLLTLHHWFGIELFWRRMLPHSSADERMGGGCVSSVFVAGLSQWKGFGL